MALVAAATKSAVGYVAEEETIEYENRVNPNYTYGSNDQLMVREFQAGRKVKKFPVKPSEGMLKFLLSNRVPQYFSDTRKVEINKTVTEIKANAEDEIKAFAGKLMDAITVEAEFVDENT